MFEALIEAIHDDVFITDGDGNVLEVSPTFEKTYGLAKCEAIGRNVRELEAEGYFKPSITFMVLQSGEKTTISQKLKNGRDMVVTAAPIRDESGKIIRVISFSRDITEFLLLKEQYSEMESQVERYREELSELRKKARETEDIVANDEKTISLMKTLRRVAPFDANVMLSGESGVGKGLFARYIHKESRRAKGAFIEINCGAIPANLLESELFGYEKGSFTGALHKGKIGRIELAQNGTLFLDEIGELPTDLQVKLLRVIQDKKITRVGGIKEIDVDFRLITATNQVLTALMAGRAFREDLYYRLNVVSIVVPSLRERREDIVPLAAFFVRQFNQRYQMNKHLSGEVYAMLTARKWPGNVRELANFIERLMITSEGDKVVSADIQEEAEFKDGGRTGELSLPEAIARLEESYVRSAYAAAGNSAGAAKLLGISQPTAFRKIQKYIQK
ncbi:MAG: sigma 54-interacting transcriptional regulator [Clostridiales Family XIII bacterium]|jgi:PAS domain S-box-containing protein|nr:sigma 54-interacting transcriptional regulator [Clostridiales Family XIII bacterium]